jgi:predicted transposase YbfD/YdcC
MTVRPLQSILAKIPDPRRGQGRRYPLVAILTLLAVALLCGIQGYRPALEWASALDAAFLLGLGFERGRVPCPATLCKLLPRLDLQQFEQQLQRWAEEILALFPPPADAPEAVAVDGKSLRGSRKHGAEHVHLLSAVSQRLGLTLCQTAVDDKTNEIKAVMAVLTALALEGRIVTMDALLTQREVAQAVVAAQGDYLMVVKENQPELRADIAYLFRMPWRPPQPATETLDKGHGRIEWRHLTVSPLPADYLTWPGAQQVFRIERHTTLANQPKPRHEVVYGITSLRPDQADASRLLALLRGHWTIENQSHWVRDVTLGEDASQVYKGTTPQQFAALRNATISLLRATGFNRIAAACRRFSAQPTQALHLLRTPI